MSLHELIFSTRPRQRFSRHLMFWLAWWIYFFGVTFFLPTYLAGSRERVLTNVNGISIIKFTLILFIQAIACYAMLYYLFPRYLLKGRYSLFVSGILLSGFVMILATRFINVTIIPFINVSIMHFPRVNIRSGSYWNSIYEGGLNSIKIFGAAIAIKMGKYWWFKQKEKEKLEREKIEAELQLLKAQIHPDFLLHTLNNVYSLSLQASSKAPEMVLKLSDILSYMLYECNEREVSLEKEIKILKDYANLEKIRHGNQLEMNIQAKGRCDDEKIAPLLLLRFIEFSFKQCNDIMTEQPWINVEIEIENHVLGMKLMNGKSPITPLGDDNLSELKKRLQLLYPGRHDLKIIQDPEIMMLDLRLELYSQPPSASPKEEKSFYHNKTHESLIPV